MLHLFGWRLEEFQHYYGNSIYDDDVSSDAARLLLRLYLEKLDPKYKPALDKAINFILRSQYPNGGWPQRRVRLNKQNWFKGQIREVRFYQSE